MRSINQSLNIRSTVHTIEEGKAAVLGYGEKSLYDRRAHLIPHRIYCSDRRVQQYCHSRRGNVIYNAIYLHCLTHMLIIIYMCIYTMAAPAWFSRE
jgi:hypothetical protein